MNLVLSVRLRLAWSISSVPWKLPFPKGRKFIKKIAQETTVINDLLTLQSVAYSYHSGSSTWISVYVLGSLRKLHAERSVDSSYRRHSLGAWRDPASIQNLTYTQKLSMELAHNFLNSKLIFSELWVKLIHRGFKVVQSIACLKYILNNLEL